MFCGKCGTENDDGSRFCKKCGEALSAKGLMPSLGIDFDKKDDSQPKTESNGVDITSKLSSIKLSKKTILSSAAVIIIFIVILIIANNQGKKINLNKYLTFTSEGYDGYGRVEANIDWDAIESKYGKKVKYTDLAQKEYGEFINTTTPMDELRGVAHIEFDRNGDISNGDLIQYTWDIDEEELKFFNCQLKYKDGEYKVEGLTELGQFDAFADVNVSFSGISPSGQIDYDYYGNELSRYDFECDKTSGLRNGDNVKLSIRQKDPGYYAQNFGKVPNTFEKTYTVSGLQEYIESYSDLTEDFITSLKSETEDTIYAYTASSYSKSTALNNLQYTGYILRSIKNTDDYWIDTYNDIFIIYSGTITSSENKFSATKVYYPVRFSNILSDGVNLSYKSKSGVEGYSSIGDSWYYSTSGYINPIICYNEIAVAKKDSYNIEAGDGFESYSDYDDITALSDISDNYKNDILNDAIGRVENYIADNYSDHITTTEITKAGEYLLIAKNLSLDFSKNNSYFVVVSSVLTIDSDGFDEPITVYYPVEYDGIVKLPGNEYMFTSSSGIVGYTSLSFWYSTKGYTDGSEMFSQVVTKNRENYTSEVSGDISEFGK